jgi:hypothetical protein
MTPWMTRWAGWTIAPFRLWTDSLGIGIANPYLKSRSRRRIRWSWWSDADLWFPLAMFASISRIRWPSSSLVVNT